MTGATEPNASSTNRSEAPRWAASLRVWLVAYLVVIAAVTLAAVRFRSWALDVFGTPTAQQQWETWRSDVQGAQDRPGPVARRVPLSDAPPALILMRDHFASCLAIALMLTTALFATFMLMIRGSMAQAHSGGSTSPP